MKFMLPQFNRFINPLNKSSFNEIKIINDDVIFVKTELYSLKADLIQLHLDFEYLQMLMIIIIMIVSFYKHR